MRDNGNREPFGGEGGSGVVKPSHWTPTDYQLSSHEGFAPEYIAVRNDEEFHATISPTKLLANPPAWTHRDDLPCTTRVPKGNQPDLYDTNDRKVAKALCAGCPVKQACLADAMAEEEGLGGRSRYLVRGGLTPKDRAGQALSNS